MKNDNDDSKYILSNNSFFHLAFDACVVLYLLEDFCPNFLQL